MGSFWHQVWKRFLSHPIGVFALGTVGLFVLVALIAPFLASSKPLFLIYDGALYFPLFRYLFFNGFFTKPLDLFFNLFIVTVPLLILFLLVLPRKWAFAGFVLLQAVGFIYIYQGLHNPASDQQLAKSKQEAIQRAFQKGGVEPVSEVLSWPFELKHLSPYAKLNLITASLNSEQHNQVIYELTGKRDLPTVYNLTKGQEEDVLKRAQEDVSDPLLQVQAQAVFDKRAWIQNESKKIHTMIMPLFRPFHWEDDAGGSAAMNRQVPWYELTRTNQKDLTAALIFGVRISLVVGVVAIGIALIIGIPVGSIAGYYGGKTDILISRLLEIWESMPTFFMLLLVIGILQNKSIFLVILVIGLFGWTGFSRYIRGEFFKQKGLPYVEAGKTMGFSDRYLMFTHILPNAIPPVLTLLPFAIMGAITSEAGLSFLGLGEEGSCSWGVLMDEGRQAFPGQSYLLWPPAIVLTTLLVAIALVGDAFRDALDPRAQKS